MNGKGSSVKISEEEKMLFQQKTNDIQDKIKKFALKEKELLSSVKQNSPNSALTYLALADETLDIVQHWLEIDAASRVYLDRKNEKSLDEGRKSLIQSLSYWEKVVTNFVDVPFSDYSEKLAEIASFSSGQRYNLVEKTRKTINQLKSAYEENSRWKWTFVELDGRYAAVAKNTLDLKNLISNISPSSPNYEPTIRHLHTMKELLTRAAERYREKYELSTGNADDFQKGISFLGAIARIYALTGERNEAEEAKKKQKVWAAKLEADIKRKKTQGVR